MRNKILVSLIVAASIGTAAWSSMGQSQRAAGVSYEYQLIFDFSNTDQKGQEDGLKNLNRLGAQGWEVVTVTTETNYPSRIWLKRVKK